MKRATRLQVSMVTRVKQYVEHRRSLGFKLESAAFVLFDFARFADRVGHRGSLTTKLMLQWATCNSKHSLRSQSSRLCTVRGFAKYLAALDGRSQVPELRLLSANFRRAQPHIYTESQLRQLLHAAARLRPTYPLRAHTYATLFGLLAWISTRPNPHKISAGHSGILLGISWAFASNHRRGMDALIARSGQPYLTLIRRIARRFSSGGTDRTPHR
jgi:hypothetical protein